MGGPRWDWESPGCWIRWIQLVYDNRFSSVFEYGDAFTDGKIDFGSITGEECPLCGGTGCFREIEPYYRRAIELFPYREGRIPIARFQCRREVRTFSLLPYQLAPYRLYTIESMILAVLVWCEFHREEEGESPDAVGSLHDDCRVTPWLLRNWLWVVVMGFRGAHSVLCHWYDLSKIHSGDSPAEMLDEVYDYHRSFGARGPPSISELRRMVRSYSRHTRCHLLGIPSQER